jgi:diguanylate cyclase (GGDEF)-like protein/PAS domain S-box-containing protein
MLSRRTVLKQGWKDWVPPVMAWFAAFDRCKAQFRALAASHERMNLALEGGGLGLWEWELESGRFTLDERLLGLLGYAPDNSRVDNATFFERLHPEDAATLRQILPPVLKGEVPRLLLEHRLRHKDGHWVTLMARGRVTRRDAHGRALHMAGTDVDRTEQKHLEADSAQSQVLLKNLTDQVPAELFQFKMHPDGRSCFPYVSKHFLDFYGLTLAQVQNNGALVFSWQHPDDAAMIKKSITETVTRLVPWQLEYRLKLPDGRVCWRSGRATPHKLEDGSVVCYGAIFDITERKLAEEASRVAAVAFESSSPMMVSDANQVILRVNQAFALLTGYSVREMVGQHSSVLKSGRQDATFYKTMWESIAATGHWEGEIWNRRKSGEVFVDWLAITVVKDMQGVVTHYISVHSDITLRKRTEDDIRKLAFFDPLTQLPNRRLLLDRLQQLSAARARNNQVAAILFIDLDRFKQLNDTHGHDQGDDLLVQVGQRLLLCVREVDTVARLGGDEFVVALAQLGEDAPHAQAGAVSVAQKILTVLNEPFVLPAATWQLSVSIGLVLLVDAKTSADDLLKQADDAMYNAKAAGRNTLRVWGNPSQSRRRPVRTPER